MFKRLLLIASISIILSACANRRADEALQAYEKIADELVEARAHCDIKRQMEIAVELRAMQVEYADINTDKDLNDEQRKRLAEVMKKIAAGGYDKMIENVNKKYNQTEAPN